MHFRARTATLVVASWLGATSSGWGQNPAALDSLNQRLRSLTTRIDSLESGLCPAQALPVATVPSGNPRTDSLSASLQRLDRRVEALRSSRCAPAGAIAQAAD